VLATSLSKYQGLFIALTLVLLGTSHYLVRKQPNASKSSKIILWVATVLSVSMLVYSFFQG
jgi:hypothetical protein